MLWSVNGNESDHVPLDVRKNGRQLQTDGEIMS